jgi:hypothetical protein
MIKYIRSDMRDKGKLSRTETIKATSYIDPKVLLSDTISSVRLG